MLVYIPIVSVIDSLDISNNDSSNSGCVLITAEGGTSILGMNFLIPHGFASISSNPISCQIRRSRQVFIEGECLDGRLVLYGKKFTFRHDRFS